MKDPIIAQVWGYMCQYPNGPGGWMTENVAPGVIHVHPLNDWVDHVLVENCRCFPRVERDGLTAIIAHNSFDGREDYEKLESLISGSLNH